MRLLQSARPVGTVTALSAVAMVLAATAERAEAAAPPIRLSASNQVPACVTPSRLMRFLATRNARLRPAFRDIAAWYKYHGESWRVRWDYAFYQMAIETNFLTYRAPNGKWGDVDPKQNNFAGIGTTGGGVPGNSFPDVGTGVLAQIQHLVVYSGEFVTTPVAARTRSKQGIILKLSKPIARRRPVTFQDLSGRWAVDKRYGRSIEAVARLYRKQFCNGRNGQVAGGRQALPWGAQASLKQAPRPAQRKAPKPAATEQARRPATFHVKSPKEAAKRCKVRVASFGGKKTLLIRAARADAVEITALDVTAGEEASMAREFITAYAPGGITIGSYRSRSAALNHAHAICRLLMRKTDLDSGRLTRFATLARAVRPRD